MKERSGRPAAAETPRVCLGDLVKDRISGLIGIVTGRAEYLYGCIQVLVAPREMREGKPAESQWFDEDRVAVVEPGAEERPDTADERAGGPQAKPAPIR